jgi:hypothetical protein
MDIGSYESVIDSQRFGVKTAKIFHPEILTLDTLNLLKKNEFKFVILRIQSENIKLINFLEDNGFRIKDHQLTYKFDLKNQEINSYYSNQDIIIRDGNKLDIEELENIAKDCFWEYGHYFADTNLNKLDCIEIYKEWTINALMNKNVADKFFVAEYENKILGYLFFQLKNVNNNNFYSYGGLGAVGTDNRGENVFSTLVIKSLEWALSEGHLWQEHNVLINNYPVNKVFTKLGFYIYKSETTLHAWL